MTSPALLALRARIASNTLGPNMQAILVQSLTSVLALFESPASVPPVPSDVLVARAWAAALYAINAEPIEAPGGSMGILLKNQGVLVAGGPFTTLDLAAGLVAANAGGGVATIAPVSSTPNVLDYEMSGSFPAGGGAFPSLELLVNGTDPLLLEDGHAYVGESVVDVWAPGGPDARTLNGVVDCYCLGGVVTFTGTSFWFPSTGGIAGLANYGFFSTGAADHKLGLALGGDGTVPAFRATARVTLTRRA